MALQPVSGHAGDTTMMQERRCQDGEREGGLVHGSPMLVFVMHCFVDGNYMRAQLSGSFQRSVDVQAECAWNESKLKAGPAYSGYKQGTPDDAANRRQHADIPPARPPSWQRLPRLVSPRLKARPGPGHGLTMPAAAAQQESAPASRCLHQETQS